MTDLTIIAGNPTPEEIASITAVIEAVTNELDDERIRLDSVVISAWQRSQRPIRMPLHTGAGHWRGFSG